MFRIFSKNPTDNGWDELQKLHNYKSALSNACSAGNLQEVRRLITLEKKPNSWLDDAYWALTRATVSKKIEVITYLIQTFERLGKLQDALEYEHHYAIHATCRNHAPESLRTLAHSYPKKLLLKAFKHNNHELLQEIFMNHVRFPVEPTESLSPHDEKIVINILEAYCLLSDKIDLSKSKDDIKKQITEHLKQVLPPVLRTINFNINVSSADYLQVSDFLLDRVVENLIDAKNLFTLSQAAETFSLVVARCDDYLTPRRSKGFFESLIPQTKEEQEREQEIERFFKIAMRLPMELQKILCNRLFGISGNEITAKLVETSFPRVVIR